MIGFSEYIPPHFFKGKNGGRKGMWQLRLFKNTLNKISIRLNKENCLRGRYKFHECQICADKCPVQAITINDHQIEIKEDQCLNCGICCHLCPTEVFYLESETLLQYEHKLLNYQVACFACQKQGSADYDIILPCLNVFSPAFVAMALLRNIPVQVYFNPNKCQKCEMHWNQESTLSWINAWNQTFTKEKQVRIVNELSLKNNKTKSIMCRRNFFSFTKDETKKLVKYLVSDSFTETNIKDKVTLSHGRQYLNKFIKQINYEHLKLSSDLIHQLQLHQITIKAGCSFCGKCTSICPTGALGLESVEESMAINFTQIRCINCGICSESCTSIEKTLMCGEFNGNWDKARVINKTDIITCPECKMENIPTEMKICTNCNLKLTKGDLLNSLLANVI
jgi:ferredoxin